MGKTIKITLSLGIIILIAAYIITILSLNDEFGERTAQLEAQLASVNIKKEKLSREITNLESVIITLRNELNAKLISEGKTPISNPPTATIVPDPTPTPSPPKVTRAS
jgi:hypothetical protein